MDESRRIGDWRVQGSLSSDYGPELLSGSALVFGAMYTSDFRELIAYPSLGDRSSFGRMKGETPDESEYLDFDFYGWAFMYEDPKDQDDATTV
jgi:hypothetical protein